MGGFPFISSCLEKYIIEICIESLGITFRNNATLIVNLPGLLASKKSQKKWKDLNWISVHYLECGEYYFYVE